MFVLYWFFQCYFCLSKLHTTLKTPWKYKHSFVSCSWHSFTNSKLCRLNSSKIFTGLWYGSNIETLSRKICEFSEFKIGETMSGYLLCSYFPQPQLLEPQLRLWSLGSGGTYGSYGAAVTGFPAGIKIDPGWGLYPTNPGLLPLGLVQNCLKNF